MNSSDKVLSVRIPSSLIDEIDKVAKKRNISRSVIVREALESFFNSNRDIQIEFAPADIGVKGNEFLEEMGWD